MRSCRISARIACTQPDQVLVAYRSLLSLQKFLFLNLEMSRTKQIVDRSLTAADNFVISNESTEMAFSFQPTPTCFHYLICPPSQISSSFASTSVFITKRYVNSSRPMNMRLSKPTTPILVSDVLDTLVLDPFYNGLASHFGFTSFPAFLDAKSPDQWIEFELGHIDEAQLAANFFKDCRHVSLPDLKQFLKKTYRYLPGVQELLLSLRDAKVEVHLCSNYPVWADLIEETVRINARYGAKWTFVSGRQGIRKPDISVYKLVAEKAGVDPSSCILLDDRQSNCEGAVQAGYFDAIRFQNASQAKNDLHSIFAKHGVILDF